MAHNWKAVAKTTAITAGEIGAIGTSMILTKKFLDARVLFQKQIAADPTYADRFYIKHQGICKVIIGGAAAAMIKNPWLKMVAIGFALEGFITEARTITTNKETGLSFFEQIGADGGNDDIDQEMIRAAEQTNATSGFGDRYGSAVSGFGDRFGTTVGWGRPESDLYNINQSAVAGVAGFF